MPARRLQLPALVLDLAEEPRILDRDGRLVGEGLDERDLPVGKGMDLTAPQRDDADQPMPAKEGHRQDCPHALVEVDFLG